jgi:hypothetical protein
MEKYAKFGYNVVFLPGGNNMKNYILALLMVLFLAVAGFSQQAPDSKEMDVDVPDNVKISLDALLKTRTSNQVFNMAFLEDFYFALQTAPQKVYSNILFSAEVDADAKILKEQIEQRYQKELEEFNRSVEEKMKQLDEENKKIQEDNKGVQASKQKPLKTWEKPPAPKLALPSAYHNLYLRVVQDGKILQRYKSPMPFDEKEKGYFSFGLILEPGKYDILININRFDNSSDGTLLISLEVPKLTLMDLVSPVDRLEYSEPVFYNEMRTADVVEKRFTVLKNKYQVGQEVFFPVIGKEFAFKSGDSPILTFFVKGAAKMAENQPQWNITPKIEVMQGKKPVVVFKIDTLQAPFFFQKIEFKKADGLLKPGDYMLSIELLDNLHKGKKASMEIPFKIIE